MEIDWNAVNKILIVRLRSIGDAVLSTSSIIALRDFLPEAKIDILLEDWVAPVYDGFEGIDEVISVSGRSADRIRIAARLRKRRYDVVYNFHGGPTSALFTRATGAKHRVGFEYYQFGFVHNHRSPDAARFWKRSTMHSAEQQCALIGFSGVPVAKCPYTSLAVTKEASESIRNKLSELDVPVRYAVIHPAAAYETKTWSASKFAKIVEHLGGLGISSVVVTQEDETPIVERIKAETAVPVFGMSGLTLPEVSALTTGAVLFIGNDSGIAHIAAAVGAKVVVIFGSSNSDVWRPWTASPNRVVKFPLDCQPCPGDRCRVYDEPKCILSVEAEDVVSAIDEVLQEDVKLKE